MDVDSVPIQQPIVATDAFRLSLFTSLPFLRVLCVLCVLRGESEI